MASAIAAGVGYLIINFLPTLRDSYLFIGYSAFVFLTLPWLISRVVLRQRIFSVSTLLAYLIYPICYYICFGISNLTKLDRSTLLTICSIGGLGLWHLLTIAGAVTLPKKELKGFMLGLLTLLPVWVIYIGVFLLIRGTDSILALDYLQHQTVVNGMIAGANACFLPIDCSNLFLQQGYSIFYHSILGFAGSFLGNNLDKLFSVFDLSLPLAASFVILGLMRKVSTNLIWAAFGTLITLLVFSNGAYEFVFFIPQTLAFLLFLIILASGRLTPVKLLIAIVVIVLSHFVMGAFLSGILVAKWLLVDIYLVKERKHQTQVLLVMLLIPLQFVISLNLLGFSFERIFQARELEVIGSPTNFGYPDNVNFLLNILGPAVVLVLAAIVSFLIKKERTKLAWVGILGLAINLATFFLAITYASKFLIGLSLFSAILLTYFLSGLKLSKALAGFIILAITVVYGANFYSNYKSYLPFYRQESGEYSAVVEEDKSLINFLTKNKLSCTVLSDPYTQLMVATYTGTETAKAHYLKLPSRKLLDEFVSAPTDKAYSDLLKIPEVEQETDVCFIYTGRLQRSITRAEKFWLQNIYTYTLDNNLKVNNQPLVELLEAKSARVLFSDDHFILFRLP